MRVISFLVSAASVFLAVVAVVAGFNWYIDPLQYYRIPTSRAPTYFAKSQRHQNPGLARNQSYDTVVIGSSLTENFLASDINRSWSVRALRLSISGSLAYEQFLVLEQALRTGQVRRVIWGLDPGAFYRKWNAVRDDQGPFPYYMYRASLVPNIEYLFSLDTVRRSVRTLRGDGEPDLDRLDSWHARFVYGADPVLKAWNGTCRTGDSAPSRGLVREMEESLERNLLRAVRAAPDVQFHLFLHPLSTLAYVPAKSVRLPVHIPFVRALVDRVADEPNVRLYDFQLVKEITHDLNRYKDPIHYDIDVSRFVIGAMRDGRYRIGRDDVEARLAELVEQVNGYDLCGGSGMLRVGGK